MTGLILAAAWLFTSLHAETLDAILNRMDADAKKFKSVSASMNQLDYNAVLKEEAPVSHAEVRIRRSKGGFGGKIDYKPPDARVIEFSGSAVRIYNPNANQVEKLKNAGGYISHISQFLLFGTSGQELKKAYDISVAGTEKIGSASATHLVLTPKSSDLQRMISRLEVWIAEDRSYPIQEKATEPSQNSHLFSFSDVKINPSLPDSEFELKVPPGTQVVQH